MSIYVTPVGEQGHLQTIWSSSEGGGKSVSSVPDSRWSGTAEREFTLPKCQLIYIRIIICTTTVQYHCQGAPGGLGRLRLPWWRHDLIWIQKAWKIFFPGARASGEVTALAVTFQKEPEGKRYWCSDGIFNKDLIKTFRMCYTSQKDKVLDLSLRCRGVKIYNPHCRSMHFVKL